MAVRVSKNCYYVARSYGLGEWMTGFEVEKGNGIAFETPIA